MIHTYVKILIIHARPAMQNTAIAPNPREAAGALP